MSTKKKENEILFALFSNQRQSFHSNNSSNSRAFHNYQNDDVSSSSSLINNFRRPYDSYDETRPSSKCASITGVSSTLSSPYIRRTPFARRSLPHQPVLKKPILKPVLSSSPDPFKTPIRKEQQLRHVVLAEPSLPPAIIPLKTKIERQFSDLSLNQIENDSLAIPSNSTVANYNRPLLSCSSSSATSSSASSSSADDSATGFVHIQMNNSKCDVLYGGDSIPVVFPTTTNNTTKSTSFIHNVSITV